MFANKQDLPRAASVKDVAAALGLVRVLLFYDFRKAIGFLSQDQFKGRRWHVQAVTAVTGEGLFEGCTRD